MRRIVFAALSISASTIALSIPAHAQTATAQTGATEAEAAQDDSPGGTIIVTGTRVANRTAADSSVPIDVIGSEALSESGLGETNKILNQLVPSFNFPQPSISDGSDVLRPATLRGLSPDQTLVLVNGKRRHVSALLNINGTIGRGAAAVDLNTIPALAIDRIEVLRDGASSQYGSDAIAGVINIQLKKGTDGGRAQVSYGKYITTLEGVDNVTGLQTTGGAPFLSTTDNRVFAVNTNGEREARDGAYTTLAANVGVGIGEGFLNVTGEYRDRNATNRAGYDIRPNYNRITPAAPFDARELTFDRLEFKYGDAKTEDYNLFVNAGVPVGELELYAFGSYSHRDGLSAANYRQQSAATNRNYATITPGTTPSALNFTPLTPDGFLPYIATDLDDYAATLGLKGDVAGWAMDLSLGTGRNQFDYRVENSLNTSFGTASQTSFDAGGLAFRQIVANADFSHEFEAGFAKPLSVAIGFEFRNENFKIRPGETQSYAAGPLFQPSVTTTAANCVTLGGVYSGTTCSFPGRAAAAGAQGFPGIPVSATTDKSRSSYAGYIELDTDLADGLTTTVAARYEHFTDFGDTVNGKLALRYEFTPGFALRGSVSNGFRAPSLHQQYFTTTSTNFIGGFPVDISTLPVSSPVARALGSKDLKPEKSVNLSVGFTANPLRGLNFTVDYYHIKIDDRVVLTENLGAAGSGTAAVNLAVKAILDANGFQSVGAARFFINGLDTTTEGVDAVVSYRTNVPGLGIWNLSAAYNHSRNKIDKRLNALGPLATIPNIVLFGRVEGIRFTDGQPSSKLVLSASGDIGDFGINLRTTRYGEVTAPDAATPITNLTSLTDLGPDDQVLRAKFVTDLEVRYTIADMVTLAVGADNLFDVYPDRRPVGARPASVGGLFYPINFYYLPYTGLAPFGFNGRFVYGRLSVDF
jgi:iron complex outermembrane receptor protein